MTHRLYIILRQDMASMTAGRCAAMASHATSVFEKDAARISDMGNHPKVTNAVNAWKDETPHNFGTVIVLQSPDLQTLGGIIAKIEEMARADLSGFHNPVFGNVVIDPEYAIRDGDVVHFVPDVQTGIYVFADEEYAEKVGLKDLRLL